MKGKREREEMDGDAFVELCGVGSRDEVTEALGGGLGSHVSHNHSVTGVTALMSCCDRTDWEEAEQVLEVLLEARASLRTFDNLGKTVLHFACEKSSLRTVRRLAREGAFQALIEMKTQDGSTPLAFVMRRPAQDEPEALEMARFLIDNGANVNTCSQDGNSLLLLAVRNSTPSMVQLLLAKGADPHYRSSSGLSALMVAASSTPLDTVERMLHVLQQFQDCSSGCTLAWVNASRLSALGMAYNRNSVPLTKLLNHVRGRLNMHNWGMQLLPAPSCDDPLHCVDLLLHRSMRPSSLLHAARMNVTEVQPRRSLWSRLRIGPSLHHPGLLNQLVATGDPMVWELVAPEMLSFRDACGSSLLSLACESKALSQENKLRVVRFLFHFMVNPHSVNVHGKRAIDYAQTDALVVAISEYMEWRPTIPCTSWFGPYFVARAKTLLLCIRRLGWMVPRDVLLTMIRHLARTELVWVNTTEEDRATENQEEESSSEPEMSSDPEHGSYYSD